jgi:hypothetical protein
MNELVSTVDLGVWRTPVEHAPRLAERVGLRPDDLWVKRDDWLGFGGGGNKLRCRLTAASARRLDLGVVLVLEGDGPAGATGNLALDGRFQADVRWAGDIAGSALEDAVSAVAGELRGTGSDPRLFRSGAQMRSRRGATSPAPPSLKSRHRRLSTSWSRSGLGRRWRGWWRAWARAACSGLIPVRFRTRRHAWRRWWTSWRASGFPARAQ